MEIKSKNLLIVILLLLLFLSPNNQVFAFCEGPLVPCGREGTPPCNICHAFELLSNVLEFVLSCLTPITALFMLVIAGIMFMLSRLEIVPTDIFSQARGIFSATVIGVLILFGCWVLLNTFLTTIGIAEWTGLGKWWEVNCRPPRFCTQCSDCLAGEYCDESNKTCNPNLPACAECNAGFGYNPQEYGEDLWGDCGAACQTCSGVDTGSGSCINVIDNTQTNDCNGFCEACQAGICTYATANTDPGNDCHPDPQYRRGGSPSWCQMREKDGNCNGSGSCKNAYGRWQNINEGSACSGSYHCSGNTYYSPDTCSSGRCGGSTDIGCCACSKCSDGQYCEESSHSCSNLPTCGECNSGFGYNPQEDNEDKWNHCSQGSGTNNGCSSNNCSGSGYSCGVVTSGDGGCPVCYTCSDSDIDCEPYTNYAEDAGCANACSGCLNGSCENIAAGQKDTYGSNRCTATHYRCNGSGSCVAPIGGPICILNWWWGTCNAECADWGYDICYDSCNVFCPAWCGYTCEDGRVGAAEWCRCRRYIYD